jgi:hypothetical protein
MKSVARDSSPEQDRPLIGWVQEPWWLHGAALAILALGTFLRFGWWLSFPGPLLPDELTYVRAIRLAMEGESPYGWGGYLYPPLFAYLSAWLWEHLGRGGLLAVYRLVNLSGAVVTVWCSMVWFRFAWRWRVALGLGVIFLSPAMVQGLTFGNLSLWVSGMLVLGLLIWSRRPVAAGLLLGLSVAIKPLAPPAILVLGAHRPRDGNRRHWIASGVAVAVAAVLLTAFPGFSEWLELGSRASPDRSVSFHRFPAIFGFEPNLLVVTAVVMAAVLALARWRAWGRLGILGLALVAVMAATPLVWNHTLVATLPLQVLAVVLLRQRWRRARSAAQGRASDGTGARSDGSAVDGTMERERVVGPVDTVEGRHRLYELIFVSLAVAALHLATGANTIYTSPIWLQLLGAGAPALAPGALLAYVVLRRADLPDPYRREV